MAAAKIRLPAKPKKNSTAAAPPRGKSAADNLGSQLREIRRVKKITLQQLAEQIGKSVGHLSQVERNISQPSLRVLQDISKAIGVQIGYFFQTSEAIPPEEEGIIVRKNVRKRLNYGNGVVDYLLSPNLRGSIELMLCEFDHGYVSGEPISHEGEEAGVVVQGTFDIWIGDKHFRLSEGDSFTFQSTTPHRFGNNGREQAKVLWVVTPPTY
jgi:transcriptional regulator with XRE-family HTH domain